VPLFLLVILAVVQGITEFLPISSSGHLVLVREFADGLGADFYSRAPAEELIVDVAVHLGTLGAVLLYFRRDVAQMIIGAWHLVTGRTTPGSRLALQMIIATMPIVIVGFAARDLITSVRSVAVIAWATLGFGVLLWISDRLGKTSRLLSQLRHREALLIGLSQILALIPGTSRSGITMTAARFLGYDRADGARFSMLLSIPTIFAAGVLLAVDLYRLGDVAIGLTAVIGAVLSFATALAAISFLMAWLRHSGYVPFVLYRLALGAGLLAWVYL
jgi:undecaprenyl-diphosphatase